MIIEALKEERKKEIMYETRDNTKEWDEWKNNEE